MPFEDFTGRWKIQESNLSALPPGTRVVVSKSAGLRFPRRPSAPQRAGILYRDADGQPPPGVPFALSATYDAAADQLVGASFCLLMREAAGSPNGRRQLVSLPADGHDDGRDPKSESWVAEEDDT